MALTLDGSASVTINSGAVLGITSGTAVASTSGTSIDFTGLPSWAKRITVMFSGVSTSGSSNTQIQIGSGSILTTGYNSVAVQTAAAGFPVIGTSTTGFLFQGSTALTNIVHGLAILSLQSNSSNTWVMSSTIAKNTTAVDIAGGSNSLSGTLDRIRITTVNGTDTFDAGSINILYEG